MAKSMVSVCQRRVRLAGYVKLYEHEVGRLAKELEGEILSFPLRRVCTAEEIEAELRSGSARFNGCPVSCA